MAWVEAKPRPKIPARKPLLVMTDGIAMEMRIVTELPYRQWGDDCPGPRQSVGRKRLFHTSRDDGGRIGRRALGTVLGVVGGTAVARRVLIAITPAVVLTVVLSRVAGWWGARAVFGIVMRAAVAWRVLIAIAPAVVVMEVDTGDLMRIAGDGIRHWRRRGALVFGIRRKGAKNKGSTDQGDW